MSPVVVPALGPLIEYIPSVPHGVYLSPLALTSLRATSRLHMGQLGWGADRMVALHSSQK